MELNSIAPEMPEEKEEKALFIKLIPWFILLAVIGFISFFIWTLVFGYNEKKARSLNKTNGMTIQTGLEVQNAKNNAFCSPSTIPCGEYTFDTIGKKLKLYGTVLEENKWCENVYATGGGRVNISKQSYVVKIYDGKCVNELTSDRITP